MPATPDDRSSERDRGAFWVIVKVTTDDGIEGVGECYGVPFSGDVACRMVEDTFERFIAGADPHDVETLFRRGYSAGFTRRPDVSMMGVFSGIEIAVWDILGKASGQPVHRPIGGRFHDFRELEPVPGAVGVFDHFPASHETGRDDREAWDQGSARFGDPRPSGGGNTQG